MATNSRSPKRDEFEIPRKVKRPDKPRELKQYDRKSPDFYQALAVAHRSEANSLESSSERFAGKAALVRQFHAKADMYGKMAQHQARIGIVRKFL